jgi:hypothetical protein
MTSPFERNKLFFDPGNTAERHAAMKAGDADLAERLRSANAAKAAEVGGETDTSRAIHNELERRHAAGLPMTASEKLRLANGRTHTYGQPDPSPGSSASSETAAALREIADLESLLPNLSGRDLSFAQGQLEMRRAALGIGDADD